MLRILDDDDIDDVLDLTALLDVVEDGLIAQYHGDVERPDRPHLPVGRGLESDVALGTALVMPAYVHGSAYFVTKLVGVFDTNRERGLPTIFGSIVVIDATTGRTVGLLDGTRITNARTGCIGGIAARALTDGSITVGVIGAGQQARWQTRAIGAACSVERVRIYSPSDSRLECARELVAEGFTAEAVESANLAIEDADVVVTATTSDRPVFSASGLTDHAVVIAIGAYEPDMQEVEAAVVEDAHWIFADVPSEVASIGDIVGADVDPAEIAPLGGLVTGDVKPPTDGRVLVESVGSAVFDAVASEWMFDRACEAGHGSVISFQGDEAL